MDASTIPPGCSLRILFIASQTNRRFIVTKSVLAILKNDLLLVCLSTQVRDAAIRTYHVAQNPTVRCVRSMKWTDKCVVWFAPLKRKSSVHQCQVHVHVQSSKHTFSTHLSSHRIACFGWYPLHPARTSADMSSTHASSVCALQASLTKRYPCNQTPWLHVALRSVCGGSL